MASICSPRPTHPPRIGFISRTFCISDELFGGYRVTLDMTHIRNLGEIVNEIKYKLYFIFKQMNLDILCKKIDNIQFHIHDVTLDDIFISDSSAVFYVCSHCNDKTTT